jgi:hypothetical protein
MNDVELESWRAGWQAAVTPPIDLKARVERETRMMRRFVVGEVLITLAFGGGSLAWALATRRTDAIVLAIGIWVFLAIAWAISFLLRRDAWAPTTLSTAAFLDLSILRCRRRHEAVAAQAALYVLILAFDLAFIYFFGRERESRHLVTFLTSGGVAWIWPVTAVLGFAALKWRRRLGRELDALVRLREGR